MVSWSYLRNAGLLSCFQTRCKPTPYSLIQTAGHLIIEWGEVRNPLGFISISMENFNFFYYFFFRIKITLSNIN